MTSAALMNIQKGTVLDGRFEIQTILGTGGFSTVYEARQLNIDRMVAIKVMGINPNKVPDQMARFRQRFELEARRAASIDHPGIITVFDYGVSRENLPYIVMELLQGQTLKDVLADTGPMDPVRALPLFMRCLDALQAAHEMGIVHKDLKPSNLFVQKPDSLVEALKILDFGIAAMADDEDGERLTGTDQYIGTAAYCAPEYYESKAVSPALDVYQMGLVLAEMLMGRPVVSASNAMRAIVRHCAGDLHLPWKLVESPLGPLIIQALSLDPAARFKDAGEFCKALAAIEPATVPALTQEDILQGVPLLQGDSSLDAALSSTDEVIFGLDESGDETLGAPVLRAAKPEPTPAPEPAPEPEPPLIPPTSAKGTQSAAVLVLLVLSAVVSAWAVGAFDGSPETAPPSNAAPANPPSKAVEAAPKPEDTPPEAPPVPTRYRLALSIEPTVARVESTLEADRVEETQTGTVVWVLGAKAAPPWELFVTSEAHKGAHLRFEPDPKVPEQLSLRRGHNDGQRVRWSNPEAVVVNNDGRYDVDIRLDAQTTEPSRTNRPRRTPGNQIID